MKMEPASFSKQFGALAWKNCVVKKNSGCFCILFFPLILLLSAILTFTIMGSYLQVSHPFDTTKLPVNSSLHKQNFSMEYLCATPRNDDVIAATGLVATVLKKVKGKSIMFSVFDPIPDREIFKYYQCDAVIEFHYDIRRNGSYVLRLPQDKTPSLHYNPLPGECLNISLNLPCNAMKYLTDGFSVLQLAVDSALIQLWSNRIDLQIPDPGIIFYRNNTYPPYNKNVGLGMIPYIAIGFLFAISHFAGLLFEEKEKKIKETLLSLGMKPIAYWLASFPTHAGIIAMLVCCQGILLYGTRIIIHANIFIYFILCFIFGCSLSMVSLLVSSIFRTSQKALWMSFGLVTTFLAFSYLLDYHLSYQVDTSMHFGLSLLSPYAFGMGFKKLFQEEFSGGMTFCKLFKEEYSLGSCILMMILDTVLYFILGYSLDILAHREMIFSSKTKFSWRNFRFASGLFSKSFKKMEDNVSEKLDEKCIIRINNVTKIFSYYSKNEITALNGVNLTLQEGQITALLGRSHAGKTTLLKMITGIMQPTSGEVLVNGLSPAKYQERLKLQSMMGICQQMDNLYDELSAKEHLIFFGRMKGLVDQKLHDEVAKIYKDMDLEEQEKVPYYKLPFYQKRKLCVAIALIGDPKILLLDEPSRAMSTEQKRELWTILKKYKQEKIILFTTHCLLEANKYADEIAIMCYGNLLCAGEPKLLKRKYGFGYNFKISADSTEKQEAVKDIIQAHCQNKSYLHHIYSKEIHFALPLTDTGDLGAIFRAIEDSSELKNEDVFYYGFKMPTLRDVFYRIEEENEKQQHAINHEFSKETAEPIQSLRSRWEKPVSYNEFVSAFKNFFILLKYRFLLYWRSPLYTGMLVIAPTILALTSVFLSPSPRNMLAQTKFSPDFPSKAPFYLGNWTDNDLRGIEAAIVDEGLKIQEYPCCSDNTSLGDSYMAAIVKNYFPTSDNEVSLKWDWVFSSTHIHGLPILQNIMSNGFWKTVSNFDKRKLSVTNRPLPFYSEDTKFKSNIGSYVGSFFIAFFVIFVAPLLTEDANGERMIKIRNKLQVSGVGPCIYWGTMLITHSTLLTTSLTLMALTTNILNVDLFYDPLATYMFLVILFLYVPVSLLFCYAISRILNSFSYIISISTIIIQILAVGPFFMLSLLEDNSYSGVKYLHAAFCFISPVYIPVGTAYFLSKKSSLLRMETFMEIKTGGIDYLDRDSNIYISFIFLFWHLSTCSILLAVTDFLKRGGRFRDLLCGKKIKSSIWDETEQKDVESNDSSKFLVETLVLNSASDSSNQTRNMKNLHLSVNSGEIVGFRFPDEAGKTATTRIRNGEIFPKIGSISIGKDRTARGKYPGHCAQKEIFWDLITLEEHLHFYATINGLPFNQIKSDCNSLMDHFNVKPFAKTLAIDLNIPAKRKLSYMISMIGSSKIILLDEPTSQLDDYSKRLIWNDIHESISANECRSVLLSTKFRWEAKAYCSKIGIMSEVKLRMGDGVYGMGNTLSIRTSITRNNDVEKTKLLDAFVSDLFPGTKPSTSKGPWVTYIVPQTAVSSPAKLFGALEKAKLEIQFTEYFFNQETAIATLAQILEKKEAAVTTI